MHASKTREAALEALRASAAQSSASRPSYKTVARETGVAPATLKRWWEERTRHPNRGKRPARSSIASSASTDPADLTMDDALDWVRQTFGPDFHPDDTWEIAFIFYEQQRTTGETARAKLTTELTSAVRTIRAKAAPNDADREPTPEEWIQSAIKVPQLLFEAAMRCPEVVERVKAS